MLIHHLIIYRRNLIFRMPRKYPVFLTVLTSAMGCKGAGSCMQVVTEKFEVEKASGCHRECVDFRANRRQEDQIKGQFGEKGQSAEWTQL